MAPEIAGVLVVADLQFEGQQLVGNVDEVEMVEVKSPEDSLKVRWNTVAKSSDYQALGDGVVYVGPKASLNVFHADRASVDSLGPSRFAWIHFAKQRGLMFVLVLPKDCTIGAPEPLPRSAKLFKDRIAVYFRPEPRGDAGARVTWELKPLKGAAEAEVQRINREAAKSETPAEKGGVRVEDTDRLSAARYATLAALMLAIGVGLLFFYVHEVPKLIENDVENRVFYLLLFPWGLSAAAFLFGAMRSFARFTHKGVPISFELGGPAALFFIVVVLGYQMVQNASQPFDLTVRAHSADGAVPLIRAGKVTLELRSALRTEDIASNGEANFKGLLPSFRGKTVRVLPQIDGYKSDWQSQKLSNDVMNLALERLPAQASRVTGSIVPPPGNWKSISIRVDGSQEDGRVDSLGRFDFPVAGKDGDGIRLKIYADAHLVYDEYQTLPGPFTISLHTNARPETKTSRSSPAQPSGPPKASFGGTWQVMVEGDISNARIRAGTFDVAAQDDGTLLVTAHYRSDNMEISCRGIGSIAGPDLFVEFTATNTVEGHWSGKGKLHFDNASMLSGQWDGKSGDSFPLKLRRLR